MIQIFKAIIKELSVSDADNDSITVEIESKKFLKKTVI